MSTHSATDLETTDAAGPPALAGSTAARRDSEVSISTWREGDKWAAHAGFIMIDELFDTRAAAYNAARRAVSPHGGPP